tara:strand:+ start:1683 stop:2192 length:510 start_codon:yes stop_codon:yes gene_type:complete
MNKSFFIFDNIVQIASRFILGAIFIYASLDKIIDPATFSDNIDNYHITPIVLNNLAALIIPWIELLIGIPLIVGSFSHIYFLFTGVFFANFEKYVKASSLIAICLLIFFIFIISQAYLRGIDVHCGCFKGSTSLGASDLRSNMLKRIVEDIVFLGLGYFVYFREFNKEV